MHRRRAADPLLGNLRTGTVMSSSWRMHRETEKKPSRFDPSLGVGIDYFVIRSAGSVLCFRMGTGFSSKGVLGETRSFSSSLLWQTVTVVPLIGGISLLTLRIVPRRARAVHTGFMVFEAPQCPVQTLRSQHPFPDRAVSSSGSLVRGFTSAALNFAGGKKAAELSRCRRLCAWLEFDFSALG